MIEKKVLQGSLPLLLLPLLLLVLGLGNASIESTRACAISTASTIAAAAAPSGAAGLGVMPTAISATPGGPVGGQVLIANANIKLRSGATPGIRALARPAPDFITLNEVEDVGLSKMRAAAPGYDAYREPATADTEDPQQALGSAIMWRANTWSLLDGGRVKIVDNDHAVYEGRNKLWDRFAAWGVFRRTDGAVVSVIAVHQMTNVYRVPQQWGHPPMTRAQQYGLGMDYLIRLAGVLSAYGPVFVGGDMNSHPYDGPQAAAPRMAAAGYRYTKDSEVIYNFYAPPVRVVASWQISPAAVHSDHAALFTRMAMNRAGPANGHTPLAGSPGCPPCPTDATATQAGSPADPAAVKVAAAAAYRAGFRGQDLLSAIAIAGVESGWNPTARNGTHYGLWQIAAAHQGQVPGWNTTADIEAPTLNARYAYALYSARAGSGALKFADWLPFERVDYHRYLPVAQRAVASLGITGSLSGSTVAAGSTSAIVASCTSAVADVGELQAVLKARVQAMLSHPDGLCTLSWTSGAPCTYKNQCPKVVDALYGGRGLGRDYGDGMYVAQRIINAGLAQAHGTGLDPLPPVGAVVSYNRGDAYGHVAIYVGGGKIFGNDFGCSAKGVYGCVGFSDIHTPGSNVTWALPKPGFDLGGSPGAVA